MTVKYVQLKLDNMKYILCICIKIEITKQDWKFYMVLQSLKHSTSVLSFFNGEWTQSKSWTNAEWTMCDHQKQFGEWFVKVEQWTNIESEWSANASAVWMLNGRLMLYDQYLLVSFLFLFL